MGYTFNNFFNYISAKYNDDKSITVYAANEFGTHKLTIVGFEPHFFIDQFEEIPEYITVSGKNGKYEAPISKYITHVEEGFRHEDGHPLKCIYTTSPNVIHSKNPDKVSIRKLFKKHYEADVVFIRRFLINTGITYGFEVNATDLTKPIHWTKLIPCKALEIPLTKLYIDFEIDVLTRFVDPKIPDRPVTGFTFYDSSDSNYITCILRPWMQDTEKIEEWAPNHVVVYKKYEKDLLLLAKNFMDETKAQLLAHWNGKIADKEYPIARAATFGIELPYDKFDDADLCVVYQKLNSKLYYSLKDVAVEEGIFTAAELVSDHFRKDLWSEQEIANFAKYNWLDVAIMVTLDLLGWTSKNKTDKKTGLPKEEPPQELCEFVWGIKTFIGLESCYKATVNSTLIDTLGLRQSFKKGFVQNSSPDREERSHETFHAAEIFSPPAGIYNWLQFLDMSRYYPNILKAYNLDPLIVEVVDILLAEREKYEAEMAKYKKGTPEYEMWKKKRNQVKFILNTTWGYVAYAGSRRFDIKKAATETEKARLGIYTCIHAIEAKTPELLLKLQQHTGLTHGYPVRYSHTDSLAFECEDIEAVKKIVHYLNDVVLKELCEKEGVPPILKLKHEKTAKEALFVESKTKGKVANARYAIHIVMADGKPCDDIDVTGFDYIRGNASKITRKVQITIIPMTLFRDKTGTIKYIKQVIKDARDGKFSPEDLAVPYTLSKNIDDYGKINKAGRKGATPEYAQAAKWLRDTLKVEVIKGDRIKVLHTLRPTKVIGYLDYEQIKPMIESGQIVLDMDKIIENTIKKKAEQFMQLNNISWRECQGVKTNFGGLYK